MPAPRLRAPGVRRTAETHVSWLFFTGASVYKVKKPVDLGFLDFTDPHHRREVCEEEVRLNRRLAPDVYRGVWDLAWRDGELALLGPCPGAACPAQDREHAVVMDRLPQDRCLTALLARGAVTPVLLRSLAERLARFHREADAGPGVRRHGTPEAVSRLVIGNLEGLAPFSGGPVPEGLLARARARQLGFLVERVDRLAERAASGRVREVHGDLHAEHVFVMGAPSDPEGLRVIDCVEFDPAYRCGDVAGDVAFLAMSLRLLGRPALAEAWIAAYAAATADYPLYGVLDFYLLYRALVRLKVAALTGDPGMVASHLALVESVLEGPPGPPFVLLVCGTVATGKTALAEAVAERAGAVHVSSDRLRRTLLGGGPAAFGAGAYAPELKALVYGTLIDAGREVLASGRAVVLDATYGDPERRRAAARLARDAGVPFRVVSLRAAESVLRARLETRTRGPAGDTDARVEHLPGMLAAWRAPDEIPPDLRVDLDTGRVPLEDAVEAVLTVLPRRPAPPRSPAAERNA